MFVNKGRIDESIRIQKLAEQAQVELDSHADIMSHYDVSIRGFALIREESFLYAKPEQIKAFMQKTFDRLDSILQAQHYSDPQGLAALKEYQSRLRSIVEDHATMTKYLRNHQDSLFFEIFKLDKGNYNNLGQYREKFMNNILSFEEDIKQQARTHFVSSTESILYISIFMVLMGLPSIALVMLRLGQEKVDRQKLLLELDKNNKHYLFNPGLPTNYEELNEANAHQAQAIINQSIDNFKKASTIIKSMAQGIYQVSWEGLSSDNTSLNEATLAGDLIRMRDQMKKAKEEDSKRLWSNEGYAKFADLLRFQDDSFEEKISIFLSELIKYVKANQGALFTVNKDDIQEPFLEMSVCYAYGRQKHLKKTVFPGEGLVGQAYQEGDIIFLTDIPAGYIEITSGLGQALPTSVLIVPLKNNEKVVGILELASFQVFEEFEILFISKLLESLAATLVSASINERTKQLLAESQQKAEEMRAQEEEMRQNMEELNATQEEMHRKEKEYLAIIESLDKQKITLKK